MPTDSKCLAQDFLGGCPDLQGAENSKISKMCQRTVKGNFQLIFVKMEDTYQVLVRKVLLRTHTCEPRDRACLSFGGTEVPVQGSPPPDTGAVLWGDESHRHFCSRNYKCSGPRTVSLASPGQLAGLPPTRQGVQQAALWRCGVPGGLASLGQ